MDTRKVFWNYSVHSIIRANGGEGMHGKLRNTINPNFILLATLEPVVDWSGWLVCDAQSAMRVAEI
jgi:hypothetical protein